MTGAAPSGVVTFLFTDVEGCGFWASGGLHKGVRHLTEILVGHADDEAGQHIRVGGQCRLDLRRVKTW